jgi:photosystem II stability/assembly factor-like uncharacterized protein
MKKVVVILMVLGVFVVGLTAGSFAGEIIWQDIGRGNLNLKTVLVNPGDNRIIYIGTNRGVLKTEDGGESWRNILLIKGQNQAVNFLLFDSLDKNSLYAATGNGLYYSNNQGKDWKRLFQGKNALENDCITLGILPYAIYLGSKQGLLLSKDKGRSWIKERGKLGNSHILTIAYNLKEPKFVYIACLDGIFKTQDAGQSWERIFVSSPTENGQDIEEMTEDQDEEERFSGIRYISIDPTNPNYLYLATARGVYQSRDRGTAWELLSGQGSLNREVKFLLISKESRLYAVTKSAVFEYKQDKWHELSLGLAVEETSFLSLDNQDNLYAACDKGLFKTNTGYFVKDRQNDIASLYIKDEPEINEVQQAAIRYAEVYPEKIERWRKQAAKKAWLPQVSLGVNRNTTDLWHWEGGSTTKTDDDILRRGRDSIDWDVTLSWNLGELIWNDDQTNIDVRSKLMVQLRPLNVHIWSLL